MSYFSMAILLMVLTSYCMASSPLFCHTHYEKVLTESEAGIEILKEMKEFNFFDLPKISLDEALKRNSLLLGALSKHRGSYVDKKRIDEVFLRLKSNPLFSTQMTKKYNPTGGSPYCFGVAMYAHLSALNLKIPKDNIRKVWLIGDMSYKRDDWSFHVALMIHDGKSWWIIDEIFNQAKKLEDWYVEVKDLTEGQKIEIFVTEAQRFSPNYDRAYSI